MATLVDADAAHNFIALVHERVVAALSEMSSWITADNYDLFIHPDNSALSVARYGWRPPMPKQQVLQLCCMRPDGETMHTTCFPIGDAKRMADAVIANAEAGLNVYCELRTVHPGGNGRGRVSETCSVFAFGVDRDVDTNKAGRALNGNASATVETSPGNTQEWLFLDRALTADEAVLLRVAWPNSRCHGCCGNHPVELIKITQLSRMTHRGGNLARLRREKSAWAVGAADSP